VVTASDDETARIWDANSGALITELQGHTGWVNSASFSIDGSRVVTASGDKTAQVWSVESGALITVLQGHTGWVNSASFSIDGSRVVTASDDAIAQVWDAETGVEIVEIEGHAGDVISANFSSNKNYIITASEDGTARVWDLALGILIAELSGHTRAVYSASFSPDGTRIVTASGDQIAQLWDFTSDDLVAHFRHDRFTRLNDTHFSPDGTRILTVIFDEANGKSTAQIRDIKSGNLIAELIPPTIAGIRTEMYEASFSPDGTRVLTRVYNEVNDSETTLVWDAQSGRLISEPIQTELRHTRIYDVSFSSDGSRLLTVSEDETRESETAFVQNADTGAVIAEINSTEIHDTIFSPNGTRFLTITDDETRNNQAQLWNANSGELIAGLSNFPIYEANFSSDSTRIVSISRDETQAIDIAQVWDADSGVLLTELNPGAIAGRTSGIYIGDINFSPDGTRILAIVEDEYEESQAAWLWNADSGEFIAKFGINLQQRIAQRDFDIMFSPDSRRILTNDDNETVHMWDADSGKLIASLEHSDGFYNLESTWFSPDGTRLITFGNGGSWVWDATSGKLIAQFRGAASIGFDVSPNGSRIVTTGHDQLAWARGDGPITSIGLTGLVSIGIFADSSYVATAKVWDLASGTLVSELQNYSGRVLDTNFSPDGTGIVTAHSDSTARIWDAASGEMVAELQHEGSVNHARFSPDGSRIITVSRDGLGEVIRIWQVNDLDSLLSRGCQHLETTFMTAPAALEILSVCQTPARKKAAASALVKIGDAFATEGQIDVAIERYQKALEWDPALQINPTQRAQRLASDAEAEGN